MPNMCPSKKKKKLKYVHKLTPQAKILKAKIDCINDMITEIRLKYNTLDNDYKRLMELQASLMSKRFKIEGIKPSGNPPGPSTLVNLKPNVAKKLPPRPAEDKEAINKTKLDLKSLFVSTAEKEEDSD